MSYFAHNPEAYDGICIKAITDRLLIEAGLDADPEQRAFLECVVDALYHARIKVPKSSFPELTNVTDALLDWAHQETLDQEKHYFDKFVR